MKIRNYLLVIALMFSSFAGVTSASAKTNMTKEQAEMRVTQMKDRIAEIKAMDLSTLDKSQKADIKHELKDMKKELRQDPIIYISGGALILIIILLIILL